MWLVVALAGTGCNQLLGIDELTRVDGGPGGIDSPSTIDAVQIDSPAGTICAMLASPVVCIPLPTGAVSIGDIDTDNDTKCTTLAGSGICAIVGDTLTIPAGDTSTITGSKPLMLIATTTIKVSGALDASSTNTGVVVGRHGAGSDPVPTACGNLAAGTNSNDGAGGGAGGTFGTKGGDGGRGGGPGGLGAVGATAQVPTIFRAGCRGSAGGNAVSGPGGFGGGALYLLAGVSIEIEDRVDANGAGGTGANSGEAGGGGGGSGGMILLEAPSITLIGSAAQLTANGGGGGEGTVGTNAQEGDESGDWDEAAAGGTGLSLNGGAGGLGALASGAGGTGVVGISGGQNNDGGGGGGGGGVGVVWIKGPAPTGAEANQISPPATMK